MAAIYSGIHLKLKGSRTQWEDKLKLARFAWISHQCFLPNKEQVLLDWVSHSLIGYYNKKFELSQSVLGELWAYLDDILHSKKLQNLTKERKNISLRFAVAQVINEQILESVSPEAPVKLSTLLSCCQGILSSSMLSVIYTTKNELMVDLLNKLSLLACSELKSQVAVLRPQLFEVLLLTLDHYMLVQRQQTNPNRIFRQVTAQLFQPCLLLRHLLTTRAWAAEDNSTVRHHLSKEIRNKIDVLLHTGIFLPDHFSSYKQELLPAKEATGVKRGPVTKALLTPVHVILTKLSDTEFYDPSLHFAVKANSLPLLYKISLDSYCKGGANQLVGFYMFSRFVTCLGLSQEKDSVEIFNKSDWSLALLALENLLISTLSSDIYNVAVDRLQDGEAQFHFYRDVAQLLLNHPQQSIPAWYRCLKGLISLSHLIVEPNLDKLVSSAWVDADCKDARVQKSQDALLSTLLQTYTKLRQLPRLFEELLSVICRPAADELRQPVLSAGLLRKLCECLLELPPNQVLEICNMIIEKCQSYLIPDVDGKDNIALKLLSLSILLHSVMFNMKSLDNTTPVPIVHRSQRLMGGMLDEILKPLLLLLLKGHSLEAFWLHKVCEATLLFCYTWVEMNTIFQIHCSKYISPVGPVEEWDCRILFPGMSLEDCCRISNITSMCGSMSQLLLELLSLQKMKKILVQTDFSKDANIEASLRKAASYIVQSGRGSLCQANTELWNRQISRVNDSTYPVAHWFLVTSNLAVMMPFLSEEDLSYIADLVLSTVLLQDVSIGLDDQETCLSVSTISRHLLNSVLLPEMPTLHSAFIQCLLKRFISFLCTCEEGVTSQVLQYLEENDAIWEGDQKKNCMSETICKTEDASPSWKRMETAAQVILTSAKVCSQMTISGSQFESLMDLLSVMGALKPDGMAPADQSRCFLLLLFIATNLKPSSDCEAVKTIEQLNETYLLLTSLQSGRNFGSVLKVLHASDILEAVMASLFSLCSKGLSSNIENPAWLHFIQTVQNFLKGLMQVIIERKNSTRLNLEKFTSFLLKCDVSREMKSGQPLETWSPGAGQLLVTALTTLCQVIISCLDQYKKNKQMVETLTHLLEEVAIILGPVLQSYMKSKYCSRLGQAFFVNSVTVLLEAELTRRSHRTTEEDDAPKEQLRYAALYKCFSQQLLKELSSSERPLEFLMSALCFMKVFCSSAVKTRDRGLDKIIISIVLSLRKLLSAPWISANDICSLETYLKNLIAQLTASCTTEQFYIIMKLIAEGLETTNIWKGNHRDVVSAVTLIRLLVSCPLQGDCEKAFWFTAPQMITALVFLIKEASKELALTSLLTVPALETLTVLLQQGEGILSNPHHVTLTFSALLSVPLDRIPVEDYYSVFHATHEVLFSVIQCHPKVMLKAAPSFLNCFYRLVVCVMHQGRQKGDGEKGSTAEFEVILKCAQLAERMYTHIASKTEEFTVFSSFIVAQYVNELQKVTLHPEVKKHLTEGMYQILDLCIEQDIKFLNTSLQMGVKEVFKELYSNYTRYHKSQRQGEEKYTA
ncbi:unhealthy ribosome biogenesis protein 2-like protein [Huso huso]|uniref:Unhealthy ribosome biogenesis protein 2-like protein n=1 Tax=Huso huso TaxID=61971 RepID=A0ABR0ZXQ2_HUSHU